MGLKDVILKTSISIIALYATYTIAYNHGQEDYKAHQKSLLEQRIEDNIDTGAEVTKKSFKKLKEFSEEIPNYVEKYVGDKYE